MTGSMVSAFGGAISSLLGKLTALTEEEYGKLKGVRKEVASLEDEFRSMKALLEKLADMDELDGQAKEWRNQVREMSYDIEDCIDDFIHRLGKNDASAGFFRRTITFLKDLRSRHQIANKIQEIKTLVKEVSKRRMRYKLDEYTPMSSYVPVDPRVVAIYADAAGLVGIDAPRDELVQLLMGEEQELKVASIVGFGGLGKTTLANQVYRKLERKFDCRAFVSVSQKPDVPRLLSNILSKLMHQRFPDTLEVDELLNNLRKHLRDKRYFIVIDDLWDTLAWDVIRCAFPKNNRGSRVLTTTRIHPVAVACCSNSQQYVYKMKFLNDQDSRRLFFSRIFGSGEACPDTFENVSADILKKCGGLPLAIISIASRLTGQPKIEWEYVRSSLGSIFEGNPTLEGMKRILDLSYRNLPHHLKTCLLYLGMYPEDYNIPKGDLVRQWIAEGFVCKIHGLDAEDVAESYFNELINKSMIQPMDTVCNDELLSCRIHDIMLDLIRSKSTEENFIDVIDDPKVVAGAHKKIRRVCFQYDSEEHGVIPRTFNGSLLQVRSVVVLGRFFKTSFVDFKYVRVLHLELPNSAVVDLTGMCRLFLLRYLKIVGATGWDNRILWLPNHIGELQELETVDLGQISRYCFNIPSGIVDLPRLSHLIVPLLMVLPDGIGRLRSLRTLKVFYLAINSVDNIERLGELTNIRDLRLSGTGIQPLDLATRMDALRSSLERLSHFNTLKNLVLENQSQLLIWVDGWSTLPRHLRRLHLHGCSFSRIPKWIAQLHDLYSLVLTVKEVSCKEDDGVGILAGLPSLVDLSLDILECPEERVVISGTRVAFRALKRLSFKCPKPLLAFEAGAMPWLQRLHLQFDVEGLSEQSGGTWIPVGIEHLPAGLKEINFQHMPCGYYKRDFQAAESALRSAFATHHPGAELVFPKIYWGE